uniref:Uncharacterized protein n=1 Tax=Anguilla anguilla TaxID=7936 RepID=A0A0E9VKU2_ANGAN
MFKISFPPSVQFFSIETLYKQTIHLDHLFER